jgi:hypothetical protein
MMTLAPPPGADNVGEVIAWETIWNAIRAPARRSLRRADLI